MAPNYIFILKSIYEFNDLKIFIEYLIKKKKKIIFYLEKTEGKVKKKINLNKALIENFLKKKYSINYYKINKFPIHKIDNINNIVISTHTYSNIFKENKKNFFFILFQSFIDTVGMFHVSDFKNIDLVFLHTTYWKGILKKYFGYKINLLKNKIYYYRFFRLKYLNDSNYKIKKLYKINTNKKILLVMYGNFNKYDNLFNAIINYKNPLDRILRIIYNIFKFKYITVRSIRAIYNNLKLEDFTNKIYDLKKNNNFYVILKIRKKSIPSNNLIKISDKLIIDDFNSLPSADKLIKISDYMIHFSSTSLLTANYFKKKNLSIIKPLDQSLKNDKKKMFFYNYVRSKNSPFNFNNLTKKISFEDFVKLNKKNQINFKEKISDSINYKNYIKKFIYNKKVSLDINSVYKKIIEKFYEKNRI